MGCAASHPAIEDVGPHKAGALSGGHQPKASANDGVWRGDSAERYASGSGSVAAGGIVKEKQLAQGIFESRVLADSAGSAEQRERPSEGSEAEAFKPPSSPHQQQSQLGPPQLTLLSPHQRLQQRQSPQPPQSPHQAWQLARQAEREQQQQQQQQQLKSDSASSAEARGSESGRSSADTRGSADVRSSAEKREQRRGVTDSAGSAEVREQRVKANASAVVRESEAADTLRSSGNGAAELSPFMAAAREAREARKALGASEQCSASRSSGATSSSLEDTFGELGACSGRAMNRLSQHYSRRLSSSNGRGSAELDRRQSLTYMKEVDAIVQSFDIQEDEIEIEMKADGSDHVLGHGSYGQVYKGIRGGVQEVAVKVLFDVDERTLRNFIQEISLLKSLNYDRNIVQFYGARLRNGQIPMMVLEFMEGGDLRTAIDDDYNGHLKWNMKGFSLALDIVKGIHFLHSHNVIHSDLKTSNVLLDRSKSTAKISDVGLARVMEKKQYRSSDEHAWTFVYAAPEMLMGRACSAASDVYSLGVCLWELVMREMPLRGRLSKPKCPQDCPQPVADLITQCLKTDPELRPTAREVHDTIKAAHSSVAKASAWFA